MKINSSNIIYIYICQVIKQNNTIKIFYRHFLPEYHDAIFTQILLTYFLYYVSDLVQFVETSDYDSEICLDSSCYFIY